MSGEDDTEGDDEVDEDEVSAADLYKQFARDTARQGRAMDGNEERERVREKGRTKWRDAPTAG